jgi:hypothetical protein
MLHRVNHFPVSKQSTAINHLIRWRSAASVKASLHAISSNDVGSKIPEQARAKDPKYSPPAVQYIAATTPQFSILFAAASTFIFMKSLVERIHLGSVGLIERGTPLGLVQQVVRFRSSL